MPMRHGKTTSTAKWLESSAHGAWGSPELTIGDYLGQFGFGVASATVVTLRLLRFTQIRIHDCMTSANLLQPHQGRVRFETRVIKVWSLRFESHDFNRSEKNKRHEGAGDQSDLCLFVICDALLACPLFRNFKKIL